MHSNEFSQLRLFEEKKHELNTTDTCEANAIFGCLPTFILRHKRRDDFSVLGALLAKRPTESYRSLKMVGSACISGRWHSSFVYRRLWHCLSDGQEMRLAN
jgi:hypothetical protein